MKEYFGAGAITCSLVFGFQMLLLPVLSSLAATALGDGFYFMCLGVALFCGLVVMATLRVLKFIDRRRMQYWGTADYDVFMLQADLI